MNDIENRITALREELEKHNHAYYMLSTPTISDREYDEKMHQLQRLEAVAAQQMADVVFATGEVVIDADHVVALID